MKASEIRRANKIGLNNPDMIASFHTPILSVSFQMGQDGIDLSSAPIVSGKRYGKAPESGISQNYADGVAEAGLSLANIDGERECSSVIWFRDREVFSYTGILTGRGSDGEPVILPIGDEFENLDF